MKLRHQFVPMLCFCLAIGCHPDWALADVYMRTHQDGVKEFTNRPSGPGWIYYMTESGSQPVIEFVKEGKPKGIGEIVTEISSKFTIDANLVKAIIMAESNCNPNAVSKKGAQGLMQLMPSTAKDLNVSKPLDPRENILGGVKYIKGLMASYGDLELALAAYNAGPGAVQKYAGIPPYRETINYVKKVIGYYEKFKKDPALRLAGE
ncbi:MAG TPA: lytic transglycosylase domain-containing protein [Desulfomonilaceae bacterium]|nr:lytic transglycosylase domain-containing protein [Desulfomonilaceae bacterium]